MSRLLRAALAGALTLAVAVPAGAGGGLTVESVDVSEYPAVSMIVSLPASASPGDLEADDFVVLVGNSRPVVDVFALVRDPMEVVVALDTSGSMAGDPLERARDAALGFVAGLPDTVRFGVVAFGDTVSTLAPMGTDRAEIATALGGLASGGETALYDAVIAASGLFDAETDARKVIVVLSDGADTVSSASLEQALAATDGVDVRAVALQTGEADHSALRTIASAGVVTASASDGLAAAYEQVATELTGRFRLSFRTSTRGVSQIRVFVDTEGGVLSASSSADFPVGPTTAASDPGPAVTVAPPPLPAAEAAPGTFGAGWALPAGVGAVFVGLLLVLWMTGRGAPEEDDLPVDLGVEKKERRGLVARLGAKAGEFGDAMAARPRQKGLDRTLDQAGLSLRPGEFVIVHATSVVVGVTGGLVLSGTIGAVLLGSFGAIAPRGILRFLTQRRREAFAEQLEGTLQVIAGSLRAGYGLVQAVSTVAAESPEPTKGEFGRVVVENRLGRPVEQAMRAMAGRMENEDLEWVVEAIEIQHQVGGNLAEVLDTVTTTIRDRNTIRRQVKALSAEGRISAFILLGLPFVIAFFIAMITPDYLSELTSTGLGRAMIIGAAVLMVAGGAWIRKIVKVEF